MMSLCCHLELMWRHNDLVRSRRSVALSQHDIPVAEWRVFLLMLLLIICYDQRKKVLEQALYTSLPTVIHMLDSSGFWGLFKINK
jgi:hypothetical protein